MQSIKVTILGKQIPLKVNDDEVEVMQKIARYVDEKFKIYRNEVSNQPESIVMILACLSIAEELFELRQEFQKNNEHENELLKQVNHQIEGLIKEISS